MTKNNSMDLKLPFGLKNGQLVQVADVESGLKCGCKCPACKHALVAKKGSSNIHHFAHHKQSQCAEAFETGIHLAAKKVIEDAGYVFLPKLKAQIINSRETLLFDQIKLHFDKIDLEKRHHDIIPDILLEKAGHKLCIEIYVTHAVDEQKRRKIIDNKLSTIEIDLSKIDRLIDFASLKEMVVDSVENKKWIFNLKENKIRNRIINNAIKRGITKQHNGASILDCPKDKSISVCPWFDFGQLNIDLFLNAICASKLSDVILGAIFAPTQRGLEKLSEINLLQAMNDVLNLPDIHIRAKGSFDPQLLDSQAKKLLERIESSDKSLYDHELLELNRAILEAIYPDVIQKRPFDELSKTFFFQNCAHCNFRVSHVEDDSEKGEYCYAHKTYEEGVVYCLGHKTEDEIANLLAGKTSEQDN